VFTKLFVLTGNRVNHLSQKNIIFNPIPLMWRIWWAPNNASKWQMGFNSAFKGLIGSFETFVSHVSVWAWLCNDYIQFPKPDKALWYWTSCRPDLTVLRAVNLINSFVSSQRLYNLLPQ